MWSYPRTLAATNRQQERFEHRYVAGIIANVCFLLLLGLERRCLVQYGLLLLSSNCGQSRMREPLTENNDFATDNSYMPNGLDRALEKRSRT